MPSAKLQTIQINTSFSHQCIFSLPGANPGSHVALSMSLFLTILHKHVGFYSVLKHVREHSSQRSSIFPQYTSLPCFYSLAKVYYSILFYIKIVWCSVKHSTKNQELLIFTPLSPPAGEPQVLLIIISTFCFSNFSCTVKVIDSQCSFRPAQHYISIISGILSLH